MITNVQVRRGSGTTFNFELKDPSNGYALTEIDGAGPVPAVLASSTFARLDGAYHQASRRDTRSISLTVEIRPTAQFSVSELRERLYSAFMPTAEVSLWFSKDSGAPLVTIDGVVESVEPDIFSQNPAIKAEIVCFDPDFRAPAPVEASGELYNDLVIDYDGTIPAGILFQMPHTSALSSFQLTLSNPAVGDQVIYVTAVSPSNSTFEFCTQPKEKRVLSVRNGGATRDSLLYGVLPLTNWPRLYKGQNRLITSASVETNLDYTVTYTPRYGGL